MKILVTGGAGFIGGCIADRLIELGNDVVVVDNLSKGNKENLNPRAIFYESDITNIEELEGIFEKEKPEMVNHQAAQSFVSVSLKKPFVDAKINIIGSLNILECCIKNKVKKIIYANSGGASYGNPEHLPIDEEHSIKPLCHYGISKHTVEHYLFLYKHLYGLDYTSLRCSNIYGPRQDPHGEGGVVAIFTNNFLTGERPVIFGDGTQLRDYCYVKDVVEANILALEKGSCQCYNIGTGKEISTQEIFNKLKALTNSNLEPIYAEERPGDAKACSLDYSKIKRDLGWQPKYDLDSGLKETVEYFKQKNIIWAP
jgi:UDP-glucose 4-epimerase